MHSGHSSCFIMSQLFQLYLVFLGMCRAPALPICFPVLRLLEELLNTADAALRNSSWQLKHIWMHSESSVVKFTSENTPSLSRLPAVINHCGADRLKFRSLLFNCREASCEMNAWIFIETLHSSVSFILCFQLLKKCRRKSYCRQSLINLD